MSALSLLAMVAFSVVLYTTVNIALSELSHRRALAQRCDTEAGRIARLLSCPFTQKDKVVVREKIDQHCWEWIDREFTGLLREAQMTRVLAPSVGITFTALGLVAMMYKQGQSGISDPSRLFGDMSVALVTTAVGSFIAACLIVLINIIEKRQQATYLKMRASCYSKWTTKVTPKPSKTPNVKKSMAVATEVIDHGA